MAAKYDREGIRTMVRTMYDFQDMRIRMANRLKKKKDGTDQEHAEDVDLDTDAVPVLVEVWQDAQSAERKLARALGAELKGIPVYDEFLSKVKGCGPLMSSVILSEYDIEIATTVSKLWAFTGLAPGRDKLVKGQKATFNKWLRTKMVGVLASSFLRSGSEYRKYYDQMKGRLENEEGWKEEEKPGHRHRAAIRYMVKMFLKDLYVAWRTLDGLPVREPYAEEYLNKQPHSA
jgi:hypothetical protein